MKRVDRITFLLCGILLTFAAFPVFAQKGTSDEVKINKQPLQDFGDYVKQKIDRNEVDLTQPFKVVAEVFLTKDGKPDMSIDATTKKPRSQFVLTEGDEQMVWVAKTAIEAVGNSGWLGYLKQCGAEKLKITLAQDKDNVSAEIESEYATTEKARTMASVINTLITMVEINLKQQAEKFPGREDEKILLSGFKKTTASEKVTTINFALPKQIVQDLIRRNMREPAPAEKW
jgi:hypothetical protein